MSEALHCSYDELPYESQYFTMTHPDRMATMALLHGVTAPPVATCRVLELGCANGGNLLPMAQTLPGAHFVGIDLSPRQVADGRALGAELGYTNVDLQALSILDVDDGFGVFDYIICHGVYSWVPAEVRAKILRVCARNLAPNGVAYVSYNTYPGWHLRGMVREMMLYHCRDLADPPERVRHARALLNFLAESAPAALETYSKVLKDEAQLVGGERDTYIFHEHLEDVNHPVYFSDFAALAAAEGLQYLAPARFSAAEAALKPEARAVLDRLGTDRVRREQYLDFLTNRTFRQTLLCHSGLPVADRPTAGAVVGLRATALARPGSESPDVASEAVESFLSITGERASTNRPLLKALLVGLYGRWPRSATADEVLAEVRERLPRLPEFDEADGGRGAVAEALLQCHVLNLVALHGHEPRIAFEPGARPLASPLARLQAADGPDVISLRHRRTSLDDFDREVLRLLDGTRDRDRLVTLLAEGVADGAFAIEHGGRPVRDPAQVRAVLAGWTDASLQRLAGQALLMAQ